MPKKRRKLNGLGAVTGERVEYFVPASIINALGAKDLIAFCSKDVEEYVPFMRFQAKRFIRKPTGKKAADIFEGTANEIEKDVARLRRNGVKGAIPVCFYRSTGKYGAGLKRAERRANAMHERFHADARRAEVKLGKDPYYCDLSIPTVLGDSLDPKLVAFSRDHWASRSGRSTNEEILARVAEVRESCKRSEKDCSDVQARINDAFIAYRKPELASSFAKLTEDIKSKFATPLNVFKAACKEKW